MEFIRRIGERGDGIAVIVLSSLEARLVDSVATMAASYGVRILAALQKPLTARKLEELLASHLPANPLRLAASRELDVTSEEIANSLHSSGFEAYYQPKVETLNGRVRGAEALARWRHPQRGLLHPKEFIEAVEAHGHMDALTEAMARDASRSCRDWCDAGIDMTVSINLSVASLANVALAERMTAIVEAAGVEPSHVIFEITESTAARELGPKLENLARLRMKGFGLSLDDYGTGYSSLQRLSRVPFTELKIDQTFVKGAASSASGRTFIESTLELARSLGIGAVAEGVESREDWELLLATGCPLAQGYYVAHPMAGDEFLEWVRERRQVSA
jgi:EAL domain-containing protein (putative c-di-GMP-specific phosphodiesterase class I)